MKTVYVTGLQKKCVTHNCVQMCVPKRVTPLMHTLRRTGAQLTHSKGMAAVRISGLGADNRLVWSISFVKIRSFCCFCFQSASQFT